MPCNVSHLFFDCQDEPPPWNISQARNKVKKSQASNGPPTTYLQCLTVSFASEPQEDLSPNQRVSLEVGSLRPTIFDYDGIQNPFFCRIHAAVIRRSVDQPSTEISYLSQLRSHSLSLFSLSILPLWTMAKSKRVRDDDVIVQVVVRDIVIIITR